MDLQCIIILLTTLLFALAQCHIGRMSRINKRENPKKIYCGPNLSQTLSVVCKGNYNTLNKKADIYGNSKNSWQTQFTTDVHRSLDYPFQGRATALVTNFRRRRRRGVYNECCEKPCSFDELSSYCGRK